MSVTIAPSGGLAAVAPQPAAREGEPRFLNRELSALDFQERVLAMAEDPTVPILERVKFVAIAAGHLDDLYGVRMSALRAQAASRGPVRSPDGLSAAEQLDAITRRAEDLATRHAATFAGPIRRALSRAGVRVARWRQLREAHRAALGAIFADRVFGVLAPLAVDADHPFPYVSDRTLNLAVVVADAAGRAPRFAQVTVPPALPRFLSPNGGSGIFVPIEDVIAANLGSLFPGMRVIEATSFRVTRSTDIELADEDGANPLEALEDGLRRRQFSPAVRLEVARRTSDAVLERLVRELQVEPRDVTRVPGPVGLVDLWSLHAIDRPDLRDPPRRAAAGARVQGTVDGAVDVFAALDERDVLVHHPYDAFATTVQAFIEAAASDPSVLAIKQTLYRTSGESPVVDALVAAAGAGKQVVVLVEIKARGDEPANIGWARMLERAGCQVVHGLPGLKTHAKLCLVVRREGSGIRRYVHIGTGNYNPSTARTYEDLGLLTADDTLTADVSHLFNLLTGYSRRTQYERLVVAPLDMRRRMIEMVDREIRRSVPGRPGRITWKLNGLTDEAVIDALYRASQAGVRVDLVVRSICALRPGVRGLSDNVTVRSILGRFLEHSRIFRFGDGADAETWIGSADMMHRNLDRRVETLVRVDDERLRRRLDRALQLALDDVAGSWRLLPNGAWERAVPAEGGGRTRSLQAELAEVADAPHD